MQRMIGCGFTLENVYLAQRNSSQFALTCSAWFRRNSVFLQSKVRVSDDQLLNAVAERVHYFEWAR